MNFKFQAVIITILLINIYTTIGAPHIGPYDTMTKKPPDEIIFGQDFLSLFMQTAEKKTTNDELTSTDTNRLHPITTDNLPIIRDSRSSIYSYHFDNNFNNNSMAMEVEESGPTVTGGAEDEDTTILSIRISTSIESQINKEISDGLRNLEGEDVTTRHNLEDEKRMLEEEIRESKEIEQFKQNTNILGANPDYLQQQKYKQLHPRHHHHHHPFVVFQKDRARSVSYTSVLQTAESIERPAYALNTPDWHRPEQNYEVDESVSLMTNGRTHGIQEVTISTSSTPEPREETQDNHKVGYVVEGRNFRKYRVEERTSDGFIVGEYGVVSHDDGSLRGVRYTADGTINPRLIYDALMKFLSL